MIQPNSTIKNQWIEQNFHQNVNDAAKIKIEAIKQMGNSSPRDSWFHQPFQQTWMQRFFYTTDQFCSLSCMDRTSQTWRDYERDRRRWDVLDKHPTTGVKTHTYKTHVHDSKQRQRLA